MSTSQPDDVGGGKKKKKQISEILYLTQPQCDWSPDDIYLHFHAAVF